MGSRELDAVLEFARSHGAYPACVDGELLLPNMLHGLTCVLESACWNSRVALARVVAVGMPKEPTPVPMLSLLFYIL
jgi:hypothetical protein